MSQRARVVGKYCESGDELIPETWLPDVERGDLWPCPSRALTSSAWLPITTWPRRPAVLWLEQGKVEVLQRREHPDESGWWVGD